MDKEKLFSEIINSEALLLTPERKTDLIDWIGHIPFAFWLIEKLRPKVFVELGVYKGDSYFAFCQSMKFCFVDCQSFAVDTWRGDGHTTPYDESVYIDFKGHHDHRYESFSTIMRMTFDEALEKIEDGSVDLLHIDGYHTYEAVKKDYTSWLPKLSDSGVVLLHDSEVREREFGVWKLWEEIKETAPSFALLHSHGLAVIAPGSNPPQLISSLSKLSKEDRRFVEKYFERAGQLLIDQKKIDYLQMEGPMSELEGIREHIDKLYNDINLTQEKSLSTDEHIVKLFDADKGLYKDIRSADEHIAKLFDAIENINGKAISADEHIAKLYDSIDRLSKENTTIGVKLNDIDRHIELLFNAIEKLKSDEQGD